MADTCQLESEIRNLAYQNWETAGCPKTTEEERNKFWYEAEQKILAEKKTKKVKIKSATKSK
jgi:hypothetical protein